MTEPSIVDRAYRVLSRMEAQDDKQQEQPQDQSNKEQSK